MVFFMAGIDAQPTGPSGSFEALGNNPKAVFSKLVDYVLAKIGDEQKNQVMVFADKKDDLSLLVSNIVEGMYSKIFGDDPNTNLNHHDINKNKAIVSISKDGSSVIISGVIVGLADKNEPPKVSGETKSHEHKGSFFVVTFDSRDVVGSLSGIVGYNDGYGANPSYTQHAYSVRYAVDNTAASKPDYNSVDYGDPTLAYICKNIEESGQEETLISSSSLVLTGIWRISRGASVKFVDPDDPEKVKIKDRVKPESIKPRGISMGSGGRRSPRYGVIR